MKRRYERMVGGGWFAVLIPETQEDQKEIDRMALRGESVRLASSFTSPIAPQAAVACMMWNKTQA